MNARRPDRVVRLLTLIVSFLYYGVWIAAIVILIAAPVVKALGAGGSDWTWNLPVPVTVQDSAAKVATSWGGARIELDDVRADLQLPISTLPWWFFSLLWLYGALQAGLLLLALHHLRRICQRVRDGAPFDLHNAVRLRSVGVLFFFLAIISGIAEFLTTAALSGLLTDTFIAIRSGLHFNAPVIVMAMVLVVLAEIFRRGAELETEQSLVV